MQDQLAQLQAQVADLSRRLEERERVQLTYPVSDEARINLGAVTGAGPGSTSLTQSINVASTPQNITVPAAYGGTYTMLTPDGSFSFIYLP